MSTNQSIKFACRQFVDMPIDLVLESARKLGVQHFTATSDAMFKRCFVQGSDKCEANRKILVRAVKDLIGCLNMEETKLSADGKNLSDYSVAQVEMTEEVLKSPQMSIDLGTSQNRESLGKLPESPKVDFAARVKLQSQEREEDVCCVVGVELQVKNDVRFPMFVRLPYYGNTLVLKFGQKVYEVALCMWDKSSQNLSNDPQNVADNFVDVSGIKKEKFTGSQCPNVQYPVCCVQFFLGKCANILDHFINKVNEDSLPQSVDRPNRRAINNFSQKRKEFQEELKADFEKLYKLRKGSIDQTREDFKKKLKRSEHYSIKSRTVGGMNGNNCDDENAKSLFGILESYELFEFFLVGNITSEQEVDNEVLSQTVRGLYMETSITKDSIVNDPQQAGSVWLSEKYREDYQSLNQQKVISDTAIAVLGKLMGCLLKQDPSPLNEELDSLLHKKFKKLETRDTSVSFDTFQDQVIKHVAEQIDENELNVKYTSERGFEFVAQGSKVNSNNKKDRR